ncbi:hypothetical protein HELRODRAFT_191910 [Helobdella robusta]|uniref:Protein quiver n=1 Tax=Helobdella robusta TaxID=6412 RepID=T1FTE7_HELRO|nr:hypothetical protein HELRODRAFT_191910 [Helobdella robusta]ESO03661.1 hypothetical protein HELRODRAFT_191910 [Helobdella robusta]
MTSRNGKNINNVFVIFAIFIITNLPKVSSINCFSCSPADSNCGPTYYVEKDKVNVCNGEWCQKITAYYNGEQLITRECLKSPPQATTNYTIGCRNVNILGSTAEICTCNVDYCNGYTNPTADVLSMNNDNILNNNNYNNYNNIKCVMCVGQQCNDPVNKTLYTCRSMACFKNIYTSNGISVTVKGCSSLIASTIDDCKTRTYNGVTSNKCLCSEGQYCNASHGLESSRGMILALLACLGAIFGFFRV